QGARRGHHDPHLDGTFVPSRSARHHHDRPRRRVLSFDGARADGGTRGRRRGQIRAVLGTADPKWRRARPPRQGDARAGPEDARSRVAARRTMGPTSADRAAAPRRGVTMSGDHYFSGAPSSDPRHSTIRARIWGRDLEFRTASGVFSGERLDKATDVLLRHSDPPTGGMTHVDVGCGWGPIACALALADPNATVWAVDTNERALELTRANARKLGVQVRVCPPEGVPEDLVVDRIWSNPPIRIGKAALHELLLCWLGRLADRGSARLVVSKHLGSDSLQRWLNERGHRARRVVSAQGFRVLEVTRG